MIIGQTLVNSTTAYSPWMPRRGDSATFFCEVIGQSSSKITITVQHKAVDDLDSAAANLGNFVMTSTGISSLRVSGIKELVRLQYLVAPPGAFVDGWTHFRGLAPAWEPN